MRYHNYFIVYTEYEYFTGGLLDPIGTSVYKKHFLDFLSLKTPRCWSSFVHHSCDTVNYVLCPFSFRKDMKNGMFRGMLGLIDRAVSLSDAALVLAVTCSSDISSAQTPLPFTPVWVSECGN